MPRDHRRWINGKEQVFKAGTEIEVSVKEYNQIVEAERCFRIDCRTRAATIPGSPEWKAARNDK